MISHYFLAIPLAERLQRVTRQTAETFLKTVRYKRITQPCDYHLTLYFFGALNNEEKQKVCRISKKIADNKNPFQLTLTGIDGFGERRHPHVLFASVAESKELIGLQEQITEVLTVNGFQPDKRAYHPHITLARHWMDGMMNVDLPQYSSTIAGHTWEVDHITLFQIYPDQARKYRPACIFPFNKK
ncbi:RNA 2',3'-cyclic phosphodiesterase [Sporolactobacillus sp. CPB3-1]|uniref:RNA 2',3'-cyclic phosphodiesterase n=1 Tax=Sporolactobacillus mangiferae TaxID=2940498 RepID=A0ABT0M7P5_9BACL|nr:RNA 2',3'-cyclic phosphodiesterase [Sporolactobacillus mangiferae]MCL1630653.1 RNA 2',3'-cyclic phosphodiesterase [Sporolactobacillus mangiferae]